MPKPASSKKASRATLPKETQRQVDELRTEATKLSNANEHALAASVSRAAASYESGLDASSRAQARRELQAASREAADHGRRGTADRLERLARESSDSDEPRL
jgi:hypothetical protein